MVGFILTHPGWRWVHLGSLGSLTRALGVDELIRCVWFLWRWPWLSLGSLVVVGFTRGRPLDPWVHLVSFGLLTRPHRVHTGSSGSHAYGLSVVRVHPRSFCSLARTLGVFGFIWGRFIFSRAPYVPLCSFVVFAFTHARPSGCWVHSGTFGLLERALRVVLFILGGCVRSIAP